jgi:hypothetical protein
VGDMSEAMNSVWAMAAVKQQDLGAALFSS